MGLIKFEVEIPNFEKELSINITIRRDGEVLYNTSSPSMEYINKNTQRDINSVSNSFGNSGVDVVEEIKPIEEPKKKKKSEKLDTKTEQIEVPQVKKRGNFMNAEF